MLDNHAIDVVASLRGLIILGHTVIVDPDALCDSSTREPAPFVAFHRFLLGLTAEARQQLRLAMDALSALPDEPLVIEAQCVLSALSYYDLLARAASNTDKLDRSLRLWHHCLQQLPPTHTSAVLIVLSQKALCQRRLLPETPAPESQATDASPFGEKLTFYGDRSRYQSAFNAQYTLTRKEAKPTVSVEIAPLSAEGPPNWSDKWVIQWSIEELTDVCELFLGHQSSLNIKYHGTQKNKGLILHNNGREGAMVTFTQPQESRSFGMTAKQTRQLTVFLVRRLSGAWQVSVGEVLTLLDATRLTSSPPKGRDSYR